MRDSNREAPFLLNLVEKYEIYNLNSKKQKYKLRPS